MIIPLQKQITKATHNTSKLMQRMEVLAQPLQSLLMGKWFKLICGASFQDLAVIKSLTLVYSLAGADCLDVAADLAVIETVRESMELVKSLTDQAQKKGYPRQGLPWLMVSLNDGEDPHFRKASFNAQNCPPDCPRPCQNICPVDAIKPQGVLKEKCYGCGRCLSICPLQLIQADSHQTNPEMICSEITKGHIQAIEIHTQVGHQDQFATLWEKIKPYHGSLELLAISCPEHPQSIPYLEHIYHLISPLKCPLLWQTDGRPMSGDIGKGTTHAAIRYAQKVLNAELPGYVQLAGGTNDYTVSKLESLGLRQKIAGVAYGSYARSIIGPLLSGLETLSLGQSPPESLWSAVNRAYHLVAEIKNTGLKNN